MNATAVEATACLTGIGVLVSRMPRRLSAFGVDRVVADAVARDHPQPTAIALELSLRHLGAPDQQRVVVSEGFRRELAALDRDHRPREPCVGKKRERR